MRKKLGGVKVLTSDRMGYALFRIAPPDRALGRNQYLPVLTLAVLTPPFPKRRWYVPLRPPPSDSRHLGASLAQEPSGELVLRWNKPQEEEVQGGGGGGGGGSR